MESVSADQPRTYTILGVIGEGGFGRVYRARLTEGAFTKDVAIKVLNREAPSPQVLARFRDEARVLALLRDRAVVSVDPPIRLGGKWAVVMDYVDGMSVRGLVTTFGALPPAVALEIIGEVARALDKAFHFEGPEGAPLRLLHRDIKPSNIQVTPSGEVRLLDFGVARADFAGREAKTTSQVSGTPGYVAPERLDGIEAPSGDVFSLGVTLWGMLTVEAPGTRPTSQLPKAVKNLAGGDEHLEVALDLALEMRNLFEEERPSPKEVQQRCRQLLRTMPEPSLDTWATRIPSRQLASDDLTGMQLTETLGEVHVSSMPSEPGPPDAGSERAALAIGGVGFGVGVLGLIALLLAVVLVVVMVWINASNELPASEPEAPVPLEVVEPETPEPPTEPASPTPLLQPKPVPSPEPAIDPAPVLPKPMVPEPTDPAPVEDPVPAARVHPVTLRSTPAGAEVFIDGSLLGSTPLTLQPLTIGRHTLEMRSGSASVNRAIRVGERHPNQYHWDVSDGAEGLSATLVK